MKVWGVTVADLKTAADRAGVLISGGGYLTHGTPRQVGNALSFTLRTREAAPGDPVRWQRRSINQVRKDGEFRRVANAVCWHGHREFMLQVFEINPDARIQTGLADYRNREDFKLKYRSTFRGVDQRAHVRAYGQACDCGRYT